MPMDDWQFFYDAMATMAKERSISLQVHKFIQIIFPHCIKINMKFV